MCAFKQLCREFNLKIKQFKLLCIIWIIIHGSLRVKTSAAEGPSSKYVADQNNPLGKHSHHGKGSIYNPGDGLLETWCYNPNGSDCAWYRECLAKTYPCEASNDSYALGFAEVICNSMTIEGGFHQEVENGLITQEHAYRKVWYPCSLLQHKEHVPGYRNTPTVHIQPATLRHFRTNRLFVNFRLKTGYALFG